MPLRAASQTRSRHFEPSRWGGAVTDAALTPPKMGMRHADFAERLLDGLQGAAGTEADAFGVTELHDGRRLLSWSAERQGKLGTTSLLKQEVNLALERPVRPGAGLMELLLQQAQESTALQCACRSALPPPSHLALLAPSPLS